MNSPVRFLSPDEVQLMGSDLLAQQTVSATLQRLDVNRLLAPFRREAGLPVLADAYGGWESDGLDGHTAGHVLSATSALAAGGDRAATAIIRSLIEGLRECQLAGSSGYVGGVPNGEALWDEIRSGEVDAGAFHLNRRWVPVYNLHKTLAGIIDVVDRTGDATARLMLRGLGEWWLRVAAALETEAFERILECEYGGMTEAFAKLGLLTGEPAYLDLARRFARPWLVQSLSEGRDELDGLHANTQIPVIVGLATIERATRTMAPRRLPEVEAREGAAARFFFERVTSMRSVGLGGNSVREHFPARLSSVFVAREGPETCNTHNMIKLAAELYLLTENDAYLLWAERARANHLRSTQHPAHGGLVYFTSERPAHYRTYSPEGDGFWCCMGSGFEAQASHGSLLYSQSRDEIRLNAFVSSRAEVPGIVVELLVDADRDPAVVHADISVDAEHAVTLSILIPDWIDGEASVLISASGARQHREKGTSASRVRVDLEPGRSAIRVLLPRNLRFERAPDGSDWAWIVDGPDVLAAREQDSSVSYRATGTRMGHIAGGTLRAISGTPILTPDAVKGATRTKTGHVIFPTATGGTADLEPFAGIHDARYTVAWPLARQSEPAAVEAVRRALQSLDDASLALEARTRDVVTFGEQQPESDHNLVATDEQIGQDGDIHWRRTSGEIRLILRDWTGTADRIQLSWLGGDDEGRIRVRANDQVLWDRVLPPGSGAFEQVISIGSSAGLVEYALRIESNGRITPRLREIRLLSAQSDG